MTTTCGGAYGSGGLGSIPFGSGSSLHLESASTVSLNSVDVVFEGAPQAAAPYLDTDVLTPSNWILTNALGSSGVIRLVQLVERLSVDTFRLYFDGPLSSGAEYVIIASATINDEFGAAIVSSIECRSALFVAFLRGHTEAMGDNGVRGRFDLANPQYVADAAGNVVKLGTIQLSSAGDLALETGTPYLRKRIIRRLTTPRGSFLHMPDYGLAIPNKRNMKPSELMRLKTQAQLQIAQEPDVLSSNVSISQPRIGAIVLFVRVRTSAGLDDDFNVTIGDG